MNPRPTVSAADLQVLARVQRAATAQGVPLVLVGAGARLLQVDWRYGLVSGRTTRDWDFAVEVPSWAAFARLRATITGPGAVADPRLGEATLDVDGTRIDLVPFGALAAGDGTLVWPTSGHRMDTTGLADACAGATPTALTRDLRLPLAPVPVLVALKFIAFRDRGQDTDKDLRDLYFIATHYARCGNEDRLFDELAAHLADGRLRFDEAGPFLLGADLAGGCGARTLQRVLAVLNRLLVNLPRYVTALEGRCFEDDDVARQEALVRTLFTALRAGITARWSGAVNGE